MCEDLKRNVCQWWTAHQGSFFPQALATECSTARCQPWHGDRDLALRNSLLQLENSLLHIHLLQWLWDFLKA